MKVDKDWGYEFWLVNNELYCAKTLLVNPGWQCSLHRHLIKDETFIIENGEITLEIGKATFQLKPGDSYRILPGTWHRFANHTADRAKILEISTHHNDKDVERKEISTRC